MDSRVGTINQLTYMYVNYVHALSCAFVAVITYSGGHSTVVAAAAAAALSVMIHHGGITAAGDG